MKKHSTNTGTELLLLLNQQRDLYHQLKILTDKQHQLAGTNSPEMLLEVISKRQKLTKKLQELDCKLQPIKANWKKLSGQIKPEYRSQAHETASQVQEIIGEIMAIGLCGTVQKLPSHHDHALDKLFTKIQSGNEDCI